MLSVSVMLFGLLVLSSCYQNKTNEIKKENKDFVSKVTDTYTVDGVYFELLQNDDKGEIKITSKDRVIKGNVKLSPPCYFLKWNAKVQSFSYPDVGVDHTLIIVGDTMGIDRKRHFGFDDNDDFNRICGEAIQGILIKKDSIIITDRVLDGGGRCVDPGTDEKDFWDFAHTRETVKEARNYKYR